MPIDPDTLETGDVAHVVRKENNAQIIGQGENTHFQATVDGQTIRIPWGAQVKVSSRTTLPGNMDKDLPLLHMSIAQDLAQNQQLESVT